MEINHKPEFEKALEDLKALQSNTNFTNLVKEKDHPFTECAIFADAAKDDIYGF